MNWNNNQIIRWMQTVCSVVVLAIGLKSSISSIEHEKNVIDELEFLTEINECELRFAAWEATLEECYYIILPSMYQEKELETLITYNDRFYTIYIDENKYQNGDIWREKLKEEVHQLRIVDIFGNVRMEKPFRVLVSENVSAVFVNVDAKEELFSEQDYSNKQYVEKGNIVMIDAIGNIVLNDSMEKFKVRGNLTASLPKKPFTFTLSEPAVILGMSQSKNWNLLANATDSSHIRNKMMLDMAQEISDRYTPSGEYVDLFINGEYQGLYLLTETMENSEQRINRDINNSIMVEMELDYRAVLETNYLATDREHYWVIHEDLPMLENQKVEVAEYLNEIESALYALDRRGKSSGKKLEELIDFDSWTDTWLLKEISSDHDLGTTSQFAIVEDWENKSILMAGPEWDFDGTMGNGIVPWSNNPRSLVSANYYTKGSVSVNQNKWLSQMYQNEAFRQMLIDKYQDVIQPKIRELLEYKIDNYAELIHRSATLDSLRWIGNGEYHNFSVPPNFQLNSEKDYNEKYDVLKSHVDIIKEFLREKDDFLTQLWIQGVEFDVHIEKHNEGRELELNFDTYIWTPKVNQ